MEFPYSAQGTALLAWLTFLVKNMFCLKDFFLVVTRDLSDLL